MRPAPPDPADLATRDFAQAASNLVSEVLLYLQRLDSDAPPSDALGLALAAVSQASEALRAVGEPAESGRLLDAATSLDVAADAFQNARLRDGFVDVHIALVQAADAAEG